MEEDILGHRLDNPSDFAQFMDNSLFILLYRLLIHLSSISKDLNL